VARSLHCIAIGVAPIACDIDHTNAQGVCLLDRRRCCILPQPHASARFPRNEQGVFMSSNPISQPLLQILAAVALVACGGSSNGPDAGPDAATMCNPANPAPTFTQLYTNYFAPNTPGHCANEDCHGEISFNSWKCGANKATCFQGMVGFGLIDTTNPLASRLANRMSSPLVWISPNAGFMPQDDLKAFNEGRDAILQWFAACAPNN
jgi:hypothetical protein